jgi:peroxiredoxin
MNDSESLQTKIMSLAQFAFIGVAALAVFAFVGVTREGETRRRCGALCVLRPNYAGATLTAPPFTLKDMAGREVSLESFRGKVVVLNFWTKTCRPCLEEMPALGELTKVLQSRSDVAVVAVSTDEGPGEVSDLLKGIFKEDPPFPVLFDPESTVVKGKYGTTLFPETWILDQRGVVRARFDGGRDWTNAAVVEFVDQLRSGSYCPVEVQEGKAQGEAAHLCESLGT